MYYDSKPCEVCGSEVELRAARPEAGEPGSPVGPADGVVGGGDPTVDERVCLNPRCPTNQAD